MGETVSVFQRRGAGGQQDLSSDLTLVHFMRVWLGVHWLKTRLGITFYPTSNFHNLLQKIHSDSKLWLHIYENKLLHFPTTATLEYLDDHLTNDTNN